MQHPSVTSFAEPPRLHSKNPDLYISSNPLTWRKSKDNTKKMGRTSHFPFSRKSVLPQTTNTHLIAEKPPPGQRPLTLSKAERILGTCGNINVDAGGGSRIGGQGAGWDNYGMAGSADRQPIHRTQSREARPVSHAEGGRHHGKIQTDQETDMTEEMRKTRSRLEDDAYHGNLRKERTRSIHSNHQSHQQQWHNDDLGDPMPPRKHGLTARASSTLLGSSFKNEREATRDLRQEKSSSTLRSYYDRSKPPTSTASPEGREHQLRKMANTVPDLPRTPHADMTHHDVQTLAAAEMRAATLREQMRRDERRPEKKASRLNIGRLFGKEKKKKDILEGFVLQDPRQMHHHQQHIESLEQVMSADMSRANDTTSSRNHSGVHDLYDHYENKAFNTTPSISEEEPGNQDRHKHHVHYEDGSRDKRHEDVSPKAQHVATQRHPATLSPDTFATLQQSHSNQTSSGDLLAFKFPAPADSLATARQAKSKTKKPAVTSIFPAPYVPPNMAAHDLNIESAVGGFPTQSQMRRLSGTPPSAPPSMAPPPPPTMRRKDSESGAVNNGRVSEERQKSYARRHWDNGSTHSSATGMSKSSKKSIFSSSNLAQNSVLSFSSDSDSDVEARFEEKKRRTKERESEGRPKTSGEKDRSDINRHVGRSKDHQRKRSSTISTPASQFSQDDKYLTIPLPSPISNRLSGPWQPPNLTPRDKERDSGSTIRGSTSAVDKRMSSSTTASGVSMLSTSSAQSAMSQRSMHSNGNSRLSRANTLSSVAESNAQDQEYGVQMIDTSTLPSPPPPPTAKLPERPKRSESKGSQSKSTKPARSGTSSAPTTTETGLRSESRSEYRSERKKSTPDDMGRESGNLMHVTPQEQALLSALRNKRAKMRDEILAEAEAKDEEDMWGSEVGELNIKMQGFEFPAPPSAGEGRCGSAATINTIKSLGALTNPPRNRDRSESQSHSQRNASRADSTRKREKKHRVSEAASRPDSTAESMMHSSRRESITPGHSLSPAPQRRAHMPQRQPSQQSKLSNHERAESDTLDGVEVPSSNSASRSQSLTPNVRHPKSDEARENALNGKLVVPLHQHTRTTAENPSSQPSPDLSDFLSFGSDDDTPRSSWNNKQEVEQERRRMARLSAFGPQKTWDAPLIIEDHIVEDDSFDDSEGEAILREWGRGTR